VESRGRSVDKQALARASDQSSVEITSAEIIAMCWSVDLYR